VSGGDELVWRQRRFAWGTVACQPPPFGLSLSKPRPVVLEFRQRKAALRQAQGERTAEAMAALAWGGALFANRPAVMRTYACDLTHTMRLLGHENLSVPGCVGERRF